MRMARVLLTIFALFFLLSGCNSQHGDLGISGENSPNNIIDKKTETPYFKKNTDEAAASKDELSGLDGDKNKGGAESEEVNNSMEDEDLGAISDAPPEITPQMLGLNSLDAALFTASLSSDLPYTSDIGMTIPYIETYGQYVENDSIHIIGRVWYMRHYYSPEQNNFLKGGTFIPYFGAVVKETDSGIYICESFEISQDGSIGEDLQNFCGPLIDLADQILNRELNAESTFPSPDEMRNMYTQETGIKFISN